MREEGQRGAGGGRGGGPPRPPAAACAPARGGGGGGGGGGGAGARGAAGGGARPPTPASLSLSRGAGPRTVQPDQRTTRVRWDARRRLGCTLSPPRTRPAAHLDVPRRA